MRGSQEALRLEGIQTKGMLKTAGPGIQIGGQSQYNRPTFCFIYCRSNTLSGGGGQSFSFEEHCLPLPSLAMGLHIQRP